jgi:hypothetical protein
MKVFLISPVVEVVKPLFREELRCTVVEIGIKFMDDAFKS